MVTRRALFGAGAVALLAGCGPPEEAEVEASDVLARQLRAEQEVLLIQQELPSPLPALRARTRERIEMLEAALRAAGGTPASTRPSTRQGLEALLEAERRALRVHIQALGELRDPKWSALFGELIAGSAAHESALLRLLDRPALPSAFPGQPVA